jgi:hypothetical protein
MFEKPPVELLEFKGYDAVLLSRIPQQGDCANLLRAWILNKNRFDFDPD